MKLAFYDGDFIGSTNAVEALTCAVLLQPAAPGPLALYPGLDAIGVAGESRGVTPSQLKEHLPPTVDISVATNARGQQAVTV